MKLSSVAKGIWIANAIVYAPINPAVAVLSADVAHSIHHIEKNQARQERRAKMTLWQLRMESGNFDLSKPAFDYSKL